MISVSHTSADSHSVLLLTNLIPTYRLSSLNIIVCVAREAAAKAGDGGAGGGVGDDHLAAARPGVLDRGHVVTVAGVDSLLGVAPVGHLLGEIVHKYTVIQ